MEPQKSIEMASNGRGGSARIHDVKEPPEDSYSMNFIMIYHCLEDLTWVVDLPDRSKLIQAVRSSLITIERQYTGEDITRSVDHKLTDVEKDCEQDRGRSKERQEMNGEEENDEKYDESYRIQNNVLRKMELRIASEKTKMLKLSSDGRALRCAVCDQKVDLHKKCNPCSQSYYQMINLNHKGSPLPECTHEGFNRPKICKSCRFWKFVFIKEEEKRKDVSKQLLFGSDVDCPVCGMRTKDSFMKEWRCKGCYSFELRLVQRHKDGKPLPSCPHKGSKILEDCRGCRRYNIQIKWSIFAPSKPVELPEYPEIPYEEHMFDSGDENVEPRAKKVKLAVCPVCNQMSTVMMNWRCKSCYQFENRLLLKHAEGKELPVCYHKGEKLYMGCYGCRHFHLQTQWKSNNPGKVMLLPPYPDSSLGNTETDRKSEPSKEDKSDCCAICGKRSYFMKLWCCMSCYLLKTRLVQTYREGKELPECNHKGDRASSCNGCFRYMLHSKWEVHAPEEPLDLPPFPVEFPSSNEIKTCPICSAETEARTMVGWRCTACHRFEMQLYHMHREEQSLPVCCHKGARVKEKCKGCLRYQLQVQWVAYNPDKTFRIPKYKINSRKNPPGEVEGVIPQEINTEPSVGGNPKENHAMETDSIDNMKDEEEYVDCSVCLLQKPQSKMIGWRCSGCYKFGERLRSMVNKGQTLPVCSHEPRAVEKCTGCRRFNLEKQWKKNFPEDYPLPPMQKPLAAPLSMGELQKPSSDLEKIVSVCSICEEESDLMKLWRCNKCYLYERTLVQMCEVGLSLPVCKHKGSKFHDSCDGCRRYRIQVQWEANDPKTCSELPPYPDNTMQKESNVSWSESEGNISLGSCAVCNKVTSNMHQWRCTSCADFESTLERRHQEGKILPSCDHEGKDFGKACSGCHRYMLQKKREIYAPHDYVNIPPLPDQSAKEETKSPIRGARLKRPSTRALAAQNGSAPKRNSPGNVPSDFKNNAGPTESQQCCICRKHKPSCSFATGSPQGPGCAACIKSWQRLQKRVEGGSSLPVCSHKGNMIENRCGGCKRFLLEKNWHKYFTEPLGLPLAYEHEEYFEQENDSTAQPKVERKFCVVCRKVKNDNFMKDWRCKPCYCFETRLLSKMREGKELPSCSHKGEEVNECAGCRRYNLQEQWKIHQPGIPFRLPILRDADTTSTYEEHFQRGSHMEETGDGVKDDYPSPDDDDDDDEEKCLKRKKKCKVCQQSVSHMRQWRCERCYKFEIHLLGSFLGGRTLPHCQHRGLRIEQGCRGCHRFHAEKQRKIHGDGNIPWLDMEHQENASVEEEDARPVCPVCDKQRDALIEWRCSDCLQFEKSLDRSRKNGLRLPSCTHQGKNRDRGCRGCLRFYLEKKKELFVPNYSSSTADLIEYKTKTCLVCWKETNALRVWRCVSCAHFEFRLYKKYQANQPLPSCSHEGRNVLEECSGCRRHHLMIQREINDPNSNKYLPPMYNQKEQRGRCPVCLLQRRIKGWRCFPCMQFEKRLIRKLRTGFTLPKCDHRGEMAEKCSGCRLYRLEEHWKKYNPGEPYPLPLMKSSRKDKYDNDPQGLESPIDDPDIKQDAEDAENVNNDDSPTVQQLLLAEITPDGSSLLTDDSKVKRKNRTSLARRPKSSRKDKRKTSGKYQRFTKRYSGLSKPSYIEQKSLSPHKPSCYSDPPNRKRKVSSGYDSSNNLEIKDEQFDSEFETYDDQESPFPVIAGVTTITDAVKTEDTDPACLDSSMQSQETDPADLDEDDWIEWLPC